MTEKLLYKAKSFQLSPQQKQEFLSCLRHLTQTIKANYFEKDRKNVLVILKTASDISCAKDLCKLYKEHACFDHHDFLVNIFNSNVKGDIKKEWDVLCGYLVVSHYHAQFLLFDPTTYVHVKFTETTTSLSNFNNTFVFIKKHVLITETTTDDKYQPLEYILVDPEDVQVVFTNALSKKQIFYDKNSTCTPGFRFVYVISIIKISGALFGHKGKCECYIEAWVSSPSSKNIFLSFLVIPEELLIVTRFLNIANVYQIHSETPWSNEDLFSYPELQKLRTARVVLVIDPSSVFCETTMKPHMFQNVPIFTNCQRLKEAISNTPDYGLISFELPVYKKTLKPKAFAPYFPARHELMPYFGDLGYTEQTLVFKEDKQFVDLYLPNRENHVVELGLVPNVVVRVNYAQVLKKRYVKSTIFTSFNVVKYCPQIEITSSMFRIYPNLGLGWLEQYPLSLLGNFENVPLGSVVGGSVYFHAIFDLSFCITKQDGKDPDVKVYMIIEVKDGYNKKFTIELQSLDFLLDILGWASPQYRKAFIANISQFEDSTVNFLKVSEKNVFLSRKSGKLIDRLVWLVRNHINFRLPLLMHLLCLRQSDKNYAKPYKVLCVRMVTKLSRHPEMKMSDILFPKPRALCYDC